MAAPAPSAAVVQAVRRRKPAYHEALNGILCAAQQILADGGSALDAVSLAVDLLEDCPLFNAGYGAVFTHEGTHELDAAIMDGATLRAGAYADNRTAAISCTGTGEMFICGVVAYDICARMAYGGQALDVAAQEVVMKTLTALGGRGGLIAVDAQGHLSFPFNTEGMYRGHARLRETPQTAIFACDAGPG
jgi:isoaspartyl peptidase/L-asparaginase-like protein (Ntn-hydrolase superfamily)